MKRFQYSFIAQKMISDEQTTDDISFFSEFHRVVLASVTTVIAENKKMWMK